MFHSFSDAVVTILVLYDAQSQGYVCVVVAAVMSAVYIVFARFELLSFDRRERYIRPVTERMKSIAENMSLQIAQRLEHMKKTRIAIVRSSVAKVCVFSVAAVTIILGSAVYLFLSVMRKVFFNLLIGWKGLGLGRLSLMFDKFMGLAVQLTGVLHIPVYLVRVLFYPFELLYQLADLFSTDDLYRLLTVTCEGAKAPIELFIDSFVLGVAILFIKSDYNFLWAMTFQEMNQLTVVKFWVEGRKLLSWSFLVAAIATALTATNPFITMLRFFLSLVNFGVFFVKNRVSHSLSPACIGIEGFQNQELLLVDATSVLVWLLIAPMLYSAAEIVCPKGGYTKSKTSLSSFFTRRDSMAVVPLLTQDQMENNDGSSIGSVVVSDYNESESSSIDTGSIAISEYNDSNGSGIDVDSVVLSDGSSVNRSGFRVAVSRNEISSPVGRMHNTVFENNSDSDASSSIRSVVVSEYNDSDDSSIDTGSIVISEYDDSNSSGIDVDSVIWSDYSRLSTGSASPGKGNGVGSDSSRHGSGARECVDSHSVASRWDEKDDRGPLHHAPTRTSKREGDLRKAQENAHRTVLLSSRDATYAGMAMRMCRYI